MNKLKAIKADDWDAFMKGDFGSLTYYKKRYHICADHECDNFATMIWRRNKSKWYCGIHFFERQALWTITLPTQQ
jgi:hypothetical protein